MFTIVLLHVSMFEPWETTTLLVNMTSFLPNIIIHGYSKQNVLSTWWRRRSRLIVLTTFLSVLVSFLCVLFPSLHSDGIGIILFALCAAAELLQRKGECIFVALRLYRLEHNIACNIPHYYLPWINGSTWLLE
jgi:hypothetical protein